MNEQKKQIEAVIDRHPIVTIGILTAGTQIGSSLINRMAKHPLVLFAMGTTAGIYIYKNRKEILNEAHHLTNQGKQLFSKVPESD